MSSSYWQLCWYAFCCSIATVGGWLLGLDCFTIRPLHINKPVSPASFLLATSCLNSRWICLCFWERSGLIYTFLKILDYVSSSFLALAKTDLLCFILLHCTLRGRILCGVLDPSLTISAMSTGPTPIVLTRELKKSLSLASSSTNAFPEEPEGTWNKLHFQCTTSSYTV